MKGKPQRGGQTPRLIQRTVHLWRSDEIEKGSEFLGVVHYGVVDIQENSWKMRVILGRFVVMWIPLHAIPGLMRV